jgi:muconolactone delta-isomerase
MCECSGHDESTESKGHHLMASYMVVATFKSGTDMRDVLAVVAEEQARVKVLTAEGGLGSIHLSQARGTVFIETFADDPEAAQATIATLPMSAWWDLDIYPLNHPAVAEPAA